MIAESEPPRIVALRTIGPVLIELPFAVPPGTAPWSASIWPAADGSSGWGRELWRYDPARHGWTIPPSCAYGTVVEFAAATAARRRQPARTVTAWYAVALAHDHHWLICSTAGYRHPQLAHDHARHLIDRHRHTIIERDDTTGSSRAPDADEVGSND
jgi:hypothetical protein